MKLQRLFQDRNQLNLWDKVIEAKEKPDGMISVPVDKEALKNVYRKIHFLQEASLVMLDAFDEEDDKQTEEIIDGMTSKKIIKRVDPTKVIRTMERMNDIIEELQQLQKDFNDLFKEYENETKRKSYVNTREYYWMVLIRQRLGIWLSYEAMKQFMDEAEDRLNEAELQLAHNENELTRINRQLKVNVLDFGAKIQRSLFLCTSFKNSIELFCCPLVKYHSLLYIFHKNFIFFAPL